VVQHRRDAGEVTATGCAGTAPTPSGRAIIRAVHRLFLEREAELAALVRAARGAAGGRGSVALVRGRAGIGKSALVSALCDALSPDARVLLGRCDDLGTPRPFGALRDLAGRVGPDLAAALRDGADHDRVPEALCAELGESGAGTVLVVEDVHRADDATLDVLRHLGRRVAGLPVLLVLTHDEEATAAGHPLRLLLDHLASTDGVLRLPLRPLSAAAVARLSAGTGVDAARLHAVTGGDPFFVHEVLACGDRAADLPVTAADAVLARLRLLDPAARGAVEQLAVVPGAVERWLADALVSGDLAAARRCGLVVVSPGHVVPRHELTRLAVVASLSGARRAELNGRALAVLAAQEGVDPARVVHHAAEAGDVDAIVRFGPAAAREAARAGAHRQAVAHYRLALGHRERFPPARRADLLEGCAIECYAIGDGRGAVTAQEAAVELRRRLGDPLALGAGLRWLSRMWWWSGDRPAAERTARAAVDVLSGAGDRGRRAGADRAVETVPLPRDAGGPVARWTPGAAVSSRAVLRASLSAALAAGEAGRTCRAHVALARRLLDDLRLDEARHHLDAAVALAGDTGTLGHARLGHALLAFCAGDWDEAVRLARAELDRGLPGTRDGALTVLGRVGVRRGDPGGPGLLARALATAEGAGEPQQVGPIAAGLAEAAWLAGDHGAVRAHVEPAYRWARRAGRTRMREELGHWLARVGVEVVPVAGDHPFALHAAGLCEEAADAWEAAGHPYERACALADTGRPKHLLTALDVLDDLGAGPLARIVRARLRGLGVSRIPRGTRDGATGLTVRAGARAPGADDEQGG
jgi:tetratricopeptide (TPR) repeat protein